MVYDPQIHHRRSIRLRSYDYRDHGAYFVTICVRDRVCAFGEVSGEEVRHSQRGLIVKACWTDLPRHHPNVALDAFIVMPNHLHGILFLHGPATGATPASPARAQHGPASNSVGAIIGSFKSSVSRQINLLRPGAARSLWQRNYYEHVIRTERALHAMRDYILTNPLRWMMDRENPNGSGADDVEQFVRSLAPARAEEGDAGVAPTGGTHA